MLVYHVKLDFGVGKRTKRHFDTYYILALWGVCDSLIQLQIMVEAKKCVCDSCEIIIKLHQKLVTVFGPKS